LQSNRINTLGAMFAVEVQFKLICKKSPNPLPILRHHCKWLATNSYHNKNF
jgi:hypothetical protein